MPVNALLMLSSWILNHSWVNKPLNICGFYLDCALSCASKNIPKHLFRQPLLFLSSCTWYRSWLNILTESAIKRGKHTLRIYRTCLHYNRLNLILSTVEKLSLNMKLDLGHPSSLVISKVGASDPCPFNCSSKFLQGLSGLPCSSLQTMLNKWHRIGLITPKKPSRPKGLRSGWNSTSLALLVGIASTVKDLIIAQLQQCPAPIGSCRCSAVFLLKQLGVHLLCEASFKTSSAP
jgi:hypothetical protein